MTVVSGDVVRVVTKFTAPFASQIQNVYHFEAGSQPSATDAEVIAALQTWLVNGYNLLETYLHADVDFLELTAEVIGWLGVRWGTQYIIGKATSLVGFAATGADEPLPAANALMPRLITSNPNRTGAKFYGGFTEAANESDGTPTAAALGAVVSAAGTLFLSAPPTTSGGMVLSPHIVDADQNQHSQVIAVVGGNRWYVQRRRRTWIGV